MAIEPEITTYTENVSFDGTREGYINAVVEHLRTHDPEAVNAWFVWDGEVITIDAAMARGERLQ